MNANRFLGNLISQAITSKIDQHSNSLKS